MIDGWQLIDSAPRDGTLIETRGDDGEIYFSRWWTPQQMVEEWGGEAADYAACFISIEECDVEMTHWRPVSSTQPKANPQ